MKVIIAGSRKGATLFDVEEAMDVPDLVPTEVVSGGARGVDTLGEQWAKDKGVPVVRFLADWDSGKRHAGHLRNQKMADYADALVAVWDGQSRGTRDMVERALRKGMSVYIYRLF